MRRFLLAWNFLSPLALLALALAGHFWGGFLLLFAGHMALLWATLAPSCAWLGPVLTRVGPDSSSVWLTFDDGPDPEDTPYILEQLAAHGAHATFFVIGARARLHPDLVHRILAAGHTLGNHTQTHPRFAFWRCGPFRLEREVTACSETLCEIAGAAPAQFRSPVGHHNPFLHGVLRRAGLPLIGWSARGCDGVLRDPQRVLALLLPNIRPGAIILLHEGPRDAESRPLIQKTLPAVLETLKEKGLTASLPRF